MNEKTKTVQIPVETYLDLFMLFNGMCKTETPESKKKRIESVTSVLNAKMEKLIEREHYTKSRTAPTDEERRQALQKYLDSRNIPKDYRY